MPGTSPNTLLSGARLGTATIASVAAGTHAWTRYLATDEVHGDVWLWELFPSRIVLRDEAGDVRPREGKSDHFEAIKAAVREDTAKQRELTHPSLIRVLDVRDALGTCFVVTKPVEGRPWAEAVKQPRSGALIIAIAEGLTEALAAAHEKHVCLLEIGDQTAWLTGEGVPLIAAFGVDPCWLAPEGGGPEAAPPIELTPRGRLKSHVVGAWTDIYLAAGLVRRLMAGCPEIPPHFKQAIMHALAPLPDLRPQTAALWRQELRGEITRVVRHRFDLRHAITLCLIAGLALTLASVTLPLHQLEDRAGLNSEADAELARATATGLERLKVFVRNARYEDTPAHAEGLRRLESLTRQETDNAFRSVDRTNWRSVTRFLSRFGRDAYALEKGYVQELDAALAALEPEEPPIQSGELGDTLAAPERDALDPLKLADPAALGAFLRESLDGNVARVRAAIADALHMPGALIVDRAFADLNQASLKQIDDFLAAYRDNPYAQEQGYIDAVERAAAEKASFASTKRIVPCGICWCFVVDEPPLTD